MRTARIGFVVLVLTGVCVFAGPMKPASAAPAPSVCQQTSDQPEDFDHGSPTTGLVPPTNYYYLSVVAGPHCPVKPYAPVHLVATIQVRTLLTAVGALPGTPPPPTRDQMWWALFHLRTGPPGKGFDVGTSRWVTQTGGTVMPCNPPPQLMPQSCLCVFGTRTVTLNYQGPDFFRLGSGGAAEIRIDNMAEDGAIVTDFATLTIVS